jgi:hypothetical protein
MRIVLDSSVVIAAAQPAEREHASVLAFMNRLRAAQAAGYDGAFAPAELWLEVHVVERRLALTRRGGPAPGAALRGLSIGLMTPGGADEIEAFLDLLVKRMRGRRPFANATDLVYLWAASQLEAAVVTLDRGLLAYHGVVCDVTRPQHVHL